MSISPIIAPIYKYCFLPVNLSIKLLTIGGSLCVNFVHERERETLYHNVCHQLSCCSTTLLGPLPQADPSSIDPAKLSPNRNRRAHNERAMSVQSCIVDPLGSNTTLSSSASSEMESGRHSSDGAAGGGGGGGTSPLSHVREM